MATASTATTVVSDSKSNVNLTRDLKKFDECPRFERDVNLCRARLYTDEQLGVIKDLLVCSGRSIWITGASRTGKTWFSKELTSYHLKKKSGSPSKGDVRLIEADNISFNLGRFCQKCMDAGEILIVISNMLCPSRDLFDEHIFTAVHK